MDNKQYIWKVYDENKVKWYLIVWNFYFNVLQQIKCPEIFILYIFKIPWKHKPIYEESLM